MKRQLQGIAIILCSILLAVTSNNDGWKYLIGGIGFSWQHLFMITGLVGTVMVFLPNKKEKSNSGLQSS